MSFFDSEFVRSEMVEISELQEDIYGNVFKFPSMNKEEKMTTSHEHYEKMQKKIFWLLNKLKALFLKILIRSKCAQFLMKL